MSPTTPAQERANSAASRSGNPAKRAAAKKIPAKKGATPAAPAITIAAEPKKKITVDLVGQTYQVIPPKASLAIAIIQGARTQENAEDAFNSLNGWIETAFGSRAKYVQARLADPGDDLDLSHVMQLMNALLEVEGGNPTT